MPIFSFIGYTLTELFGRPDNWRQIYKQKTLTYIYQTICLKRAEKKKLLGRLHIIPRIKKKTPVLKSLFNSKNCEIFKGALLGLRHFLATVTPFKMMKNAFYLTLKALFVLKIFKFLSWLFGHVEKRLV